VEVEESTASITALDGRRSIRSSYDTIVRADLFSDLRTGAHLLRSGLVEQNDGRVNNEYGAVVV